MIVKLTDNDQNYYLIWSDVVDAPTTPGMTLEQLLAFYAREYGKKGLERLARALPRLQMRGVTVALYGSAEEAIRSNRAGKDETRLTFEQLIDYYCRRQGEGEPPVGERDRDSA